MTGVDAETIAFYDTDAEAYAQNAVDHGVRGSLVAFEARLPRHARVLDYGCGGGHESVWLAQHGHTVISMDASPGLAAEAKRRFGIDVRVADFLSLDDVAAFDGVWSGAALHHAQTHELPAIIAAVARALKTGGAFGALVKAGADRRDSLGRFYCGVDADAMRALLADPAHWAHAQVQQTVGAGYDQVETPWLIVSAQRA